MFISPGTQMPANEAAAKDPFVKDTLSKVANGTLSAQAPAGTANVVWTEGDEQRLDAVLMECFGK